jgi:hypothetical protein
MAVFMNTGEDEIYAGPTKEAVIAAMLADLSDLDVSETFEVPGTIKIRVPDENDQPTDELVTLQEEYVPAFGAYCIASQQA